MKQCVESGCKYVALTRESKPCPLYPESELQPSGHSPVDFFYVWPTSPEDNRRWTGALVRSAEMSSKNFHTHPINPPSKIPVKVEADIKRAQLANPHLKTSEIMTGKHSLAVTHKGKVKNVRLNALRNQHSDPRCCILNLKNITP